MKNLLFAITLIAFNCLILFSCKREELTSPLTPKSTNESAAKEKESKALRRFSEILSHAVYSNADLRGFIKAEALKEFDNDYDVFYPFVKDKIVSGNKTFRDVLTGYTKDPQELLEIEASLPLLNIYVPELPSGFSADKWDYMNEKPYVSPAIVKNDKISLYQEGALKDSLDQSYIPGFPVLVVKNNERLRLKGGIRLKSSSTPDMGSYEFIDDAFNGKIKTKTIYKLETDLIPELITAYNVMGVGSYNWQRDNIYYGLTLAQNSQGPLNRRIIERIEAIKFTSQAFYVMSDQAGDPGLKAPQLVNSQRNHDQIQNLLWSEGRFEIQIDVLVSNLSGLGTTLEKHFNAAPGELFSITYAEQRVGSFYVYKATGVIPKDFYPHINLISWDLENNGFAWKFIVSEKDEQTVDTRTETVTNEFATNFGFTLGISKKLSLNFGGSAKKTIVNTHTIVVTRNSDPLGTLETDFSKPVITGTQSGYPIYKLHSITNPYVEMTLLPVYEY